MLGIRSSERDPRPGFRPVLTGGFPRPDLGQWRDGAGSADLALLSGSPAARWKGSRFMARMWRPLWVSALLALPLLARATPADTKQDTGFWFMSMNHGSFEAVDAPLKPLQWWFDGQVRYMNGGRDFHQSIVRPGLGFAFAERAAGWLGYAWIVTAPEDGSRFDEHRIWEQITWSTPIQATELLSRTRLEQRFVETGDDVGWRFRQFLKASYPLSFEPRLTLAAYDEVFFNLNDTDWGAEAGFDRNRLFVGLGWTFDERKHARVELGYLNQFIYRRSASDEVQHIFSLNLFLTF
jgi:hypothetical protein